MANVRIPQLTVAVGIDGTEEIEIAQSDGAGGYVSRRTTLNDIIDLVSSVVTAPIVLVSSSGVVPDGRVLTGTAGQIGVTDGGAGADLFADVRADTKDRQPCGTAIGRRRAPA